MSAPGYVGLAFRSLRSSPGFTAAAIVTLALGIGANTTIFSAVNAVLLRPPHARDASEIVRVYRNDHSPLSYAELAYVRDHAQSFASIFGERWATVGLTGRGPNRRVAADVVSGSFFTTLGVRPALGRLLLPSDDAAPGAHPVVVVSHRYWTQHLDADPAIVGSTLVLNRHPYTVVGVTDPSFTGAFPGFAADVWAPLAEAQPLLGTDVRQMGGSLYSAARLRSGVARSTADAELATLAAQMTQADPERAGHPELAVHFTTDDARGLTAELRRPAAAVAGGLLAVVVIVLLIAGTNVANMTLARATSRRREFAVRQALGAGRWPIVRQLLVESLILALAGGVLALTASVWTGDLLQRFVPADLPVAIDVSPDTRVFAFTMLVSLLAGLLFGLAPALRASRADLVTALRDELFGFRRSRLRSAFVLSQVTLSIVLLAVAALFLRSLGNAREMNPGFDVARVVDLPVDVGLAHYSTEQGRDFYQRAIARVAALPGVERVSMATTVPARGDNMEMRVFVEATGGRAADAGHAANFNIVGPGYLATLGVRLLAGREFGDGDAPTAPGTAIVNETFARRFLGAGEAVGRRFSVEGPTGPWTTVVGVARDAKYVTLGEEPRPFFYLPVSQNFRGELTMHVRAARDPAALREPVREAVQALDPALPLGDAVTMADDLKAGLLPTRFAAALLGAFGTLALLIAAVGIYGVVSYAVAQRTREIGVRAALGATRPALVRLVVGGSMRLVAVGVVVGLALAVGVARAGSSLLYGVSAADPASLVGAAAALLATALLASWLPARRAANVDPVVALRAQ